MDLPPNTMPDIDEKPLRRPILPITNVQANRCRLQRHKRLRELELRLLDKPRNQTPAECDVPAYERFLDDLEAEPVLSECCLKLHPGIVSVLARIQRIGPAPTPPVRRIQKRTSRKLQEFMTTFKIRNSTEFRNEVNSCKHMMLKIPDDLFYLAEHTSQLDLLSKISAHLTPVETLHNFQQCNEHFHTPAEFDAGTNVRQLIAEELTAHDKNTDTVVDDIIEDIFANYVPLLLAWRCTLLRYIRINVQPVAENTTTIITTRISTSPAALHTSTDCADVHVDAGCEPQPPSPAPLVVKTEPQSQPPSNESWRNDVEIVEMPALADEPIDLDCDSTQRLAACLMTPGMQSESDPAGVSEFLHQISCTPDEPATASLGGGRATAANCANETDDNVEKAQNSESNAGSGTRVADVPTVPLATETIATHTTNVAGRTSIVHDLFEHDSDDLLHVTGEAQAKNVLEHFRLRTLERRRADEWMKVETSIQAVELLDRLDLTKLWLWLHPDVVKQLMSIRSEAAKRPVDKYTQQFEALLPRIESLIKRYMQLLRWGDHNDPAEFQFYLSKYENVLRYYPHELCYLVEGEEQMQALDDWIGRLPTGWADQQECFERCAAMKSTSEFRRCTNVSALVEQEMGGVRGRLVVAEESGGGDGGNIIDQSHWLRLDESIDWIFRTYVPLRPAWSWTMLRRLRMLSVAGDVSGAEAEAEVQHEVRIKVESLKDDNAIAADVDVIDVNEDGCIEILDGTNQNNVVEPPTEEDNHHDSIRQLLEEMSDQACDVLLPPPTVPAAKPASVPVPKPSSTRFLLPISSVRLQRLAWHIHLRELEHRLLDKPSRQRPADCDVAAYARLLDDLEAVPTWSPTCLQLHPGIVSVLARLQRVGPAPTPPIRVQQSRASRMLAKFMATFQLTDPLEFRKTVIACSRMMLVVPAELYYLADRPAELHQLNTMFALQLSARSVEMFEHCKQTMRTVAEFDAGTNVRQLVADEEDRSRVNEGEAEKTVDQTIAVIFETYVPMPLAWRFTLLRDLCFVEPDRNHIAGVTNVPVIGMDVNDYSSNRNAMISQSDRNGVADVDAENVSDNNDVEASTQRLNEILSEPVVAVAAAANGPLPLAPDVFDISDSPSTAESEAVNAKTVLFSSSDNETQRQELPPAAASKRSSANVTKRKINAISFEPRGKRGVTNANVDAADRTVILRHEFQPLSLLVQESAKDAAVSPKSVKSNAAPAKRSISEPSSKRGRRLMTVEPSEYVIEDASMAMTAIEDATTGSSTTVADNVDVLPQVTQQAAKPSTRYQVNDVVAPKSSAASSSANVPEVNIAIESATSGAVSTTQHQRQYLKLTPIAEAAFDLRTTENESYDFQEDNADNNTIHHRRRRYRRPFHLRVRFDPQSNWSHLDENAARQLLQLPNDTDWRNVRAILFNQQEFSYKAANTRQPSTTTMAADVGGAAARRSQCERIVRLLFETRHIERAGLTLVSDCRTERTRVLRMADVVRQQMRDEQLRRLETTTTTTTTVTESDAGLDAYVLTGLMSFRANQGSS